MRSGDPCEALAPAAKFRYDPGRIGRRWLPLSEFPDSKYPARRTIYCTGLALEARRNDVI